MNSTGEVGEREKNVTLDLNFSSIAKKKKLARSLDCFDKSKDIFVIRHLEKKPVI